MKKNIYKGLGIGIPIIAILLAIFFMIPREVKSIKLDYESITFEDIGKMEVIEFSYLPDNAKEPKVTFISENPEIAKFEGSNLISISEGTTQIHIEVNDSDVISNYVDVVVHDKVAENTRAAQPIIDAINAIGEVTLEKQEQIENTNKLYNDAPDEVKPFVSNYEALQNSTTQLDTLIYEDKERRGLFETVYT